MKYIVEPIIGWSDGTSLVGPPQTAPVPQISFQINGIAESNHSIVELSPPFAVRFLYNCMPDVSAFEALKAFISIATPY